MKVEPKEGQRVFILEKGNNGYDKFWNEVKREDFDKWVTDGYIGDGDLVVFSDNVLVAYEKKEVTLKNSPTTQTETTQKVNEK